MSAPLIDSTFLGLLDTLDLYVHRLQRGRYSGARRSAEYGSSPEFADYRDYVPGDDLRRIDWNLAGRFDKYYIKRFTDEKQGRNCVYLDVSMSMGHETRKKQLALQMAAILGYLSVSNMDCVSFRLMKGSKCIPLYENVIGRESLMHAFNALEKVEFSGETDIGAAIASDPAIGSGDGVSYIVSDLLTDSDWRGAVDRLLGKRETAIVQILSASELKPEESGTFCFRDSERMNEKLQLEVDRSALLAYQKAVEEYLTGNREFCARRGISYVMLRTDEQLEEALLRKGYAEELIR